MDGEDTKGVSSVTEAGGEKTIGWGRRWVGLGLREPFGACGWIGIKKPEEGR